MIRELALGEADIRGRFRLFHELQGFEVEGFTVVMSNGEQLYGPSLKQGKLTRFIRRNREDELSKHQIRMGMFAELSREQWSLAHKLVATYSIGTKGKEAAFRFFNTGMYTNKDYSKFGHKDSPACQYCDCEVQTFEHLFYECQGVINFRKKLSEKWQCSQKDDQKAWINIALWPSQHFAFIVLASNLYTQHTNWKNSPLSVTEFKAHLSQQRSIEEEIAIKRDKLFIHMEKWEEISSILK